MILFCVHFGEWSRHTAIFFVAKDCAVACVHAPVIPEHKQRAPHPVYPPIEFLALRTTQTHCPARLAKPVRVRSSRTHGRTFPTLASRIEYGSFQMRLRSASMDFFASASASEATDAAPTAVVGASGVICCEAPAHALKMPASTRKKIIGMRSGPHPLVLAHGYCTTRGTCGQADVPAFALQRALRATVGGHNPHALQNPAPAYTSLGQLSDLAAFAGFVRILNPSSSNTSMSPVGTSRHSRKVGFRGEVEVPYR